MTTPPNEKIMENIFFMFDINKFRMDNPGGATIHSPIFSDNSNSWRLVVGIRKKKPNFNEMTLHLELSAIGTDENVWVSPRFSVLDSIRVIGEFSKPVKWFLFDKCFSQYISSMQIPDKIRSFKIFFKMQKTLRRPKISSNFRKGISLAVLSQNMLNLYNDAENSDVNIICCGRLFKAHKLILIHRSSVFKDMFAKHNKQQGSFINEHINIDDIEPAAFDIFLRFLYIGQVSMEYKYAAAVLFAAEKYKVADLKDICMSTLMESITVESAVDILIITEKFDNLELQKVTLTFMKNNLTDIMKTVAWSKMTKKLMEVLLVHTN